MATIELLEHVKAIAWRACDAIMDIYQQGFEVTAKADDSPLTLADLAAHRMICDSLAVLPNVYPVLSEESGPEQKQHRHEWHTFWLVDPLDGTKEFVKRNGEFTVNIALISHGKPIMGVIAAPALETLWYARIGEGAWRQQKGSSPVAIHAMPWQPGQTMRVIGSRSHVDEDLERLLDGLGPHQWQGVGSSIKFCRIAEGAADCYPRTGPTCEWDTGAAHIILQEAGGTVLALNSATFEAGRALEYNRRDTLINPSFVALSLQLADTWNDMVMNRKKKSGTD